MTTYARILDHEVVELVTVTGDIAGLFHPSLCWFDATGLGVKVGWRRSADGTFSAPVPPPPPPSPPPPAAPTLAEVLAEVAALRAQVAELHRS